VIGRHGDAFHYLLRPRGSFLVVWGYSDRNPKRELVISHKRTSWALRGIPLLQEGFYKKGITRPNDLGTPPSCTASARRIAAFLGPTWRPPK
jgi:hypothetical protein